MFFIDRISDDTSTSFSMFQRILETIKAAKIYFTAGGFIESFKSISNFRYFFWGQAISMAKDFPVSGVGVGSFIIQLPNYFIKNRIGFSQIDYSGNYYLQVLSEIGIVGLLLILYIFYLILKKIISFKKNENKLRLVKSNDNWILTGLSISFIVMLIGQFFGSHTTFFEIQFIFWFIISLILVYIKIKENNMGNYPGGKIKSLLIVDKIKLSKNERAGFYAITAVFIITLIISSVTLLSINVQQNLFDKQNKYRGWQNTYGFYKQEMWGDKKINWTAIDASKVIDKDGDVMVIPMMDAIPEGYMEDVKVRIFIDNLFIKSVTLKNNVWTDVEVLIPGYVKDKFTLTLACNRVWVPKNIGLNKDTRELGVLVGQINFLH